VSRQPKIQLSHLREIGWKYWDPIGLWVLLKGDRADCADEYNRYLLHVVSLLTGGTERSVAAAYLDDKAADHMGLGHRADCTAGKRTVDAIASYLRGLPNSPPIAD
jgi:hypothetical protein